MDKLLAIISVYAAYLVLLITIKNLDAIKTVAILLTIFSAAASGFILFGGFVFTGSILMGLFMASIVAFIFGSMIWAPFYLKRIKSQPAPPPYSSPGAGSESGEA